jgi:hypothetical protein
VPNSDLWPALASIQASLLSDARSHSVNWPSSTHKVFSPSSFFSELELAAAEKLDSADQALAQDEHPSWMPGGVVQFSVAGIQLTAVLDRHIADERWLAWVACGEPDWAAAFDVLLEPQDEPFDHGFGVIQAWNSFEIEHTLDLRYEVIGQLSSERLAIIREVAKEHIVGLLLNIPPEPGVVALRTVNGLCMALTGTPLGINDPRNDYQATYRTVAARITAFQLTSRFASAALVNEQDGQVPSRALEIDFFVRLKPTTRVHEMLPLLRATFSYIISGPDQDFVYGIKTNRLDLAKTMFVQSVLIEKVLDA